MTQTLDSQERDRIVVAAADLLARDVLATMTDVAAAANIDIDSLHEYFPQRGDLIWALGKLGTDRMEASLDAARVEEGPALDAIHRLVEEALPFAAFLAFMYGENQLHGPGELDDAWVRIGTRGRELFARGQREGAIREDLVPAWMSETLWVMLAVSSWTIVDGHLKPEDAYRSIVELLIDGARR